MKKLLTISLCGLLFGSAPAYAHKEWVHQYMVQESYRFLEQQLGPIPVLKDAVGLAFHGPGDGLRPFNNPCPIAVGAWREDTEDPVYHYAAGNGFTPSITHFWEADNSDENHESMWLNGIGSSKAPNAWEKARVYLFCQDRNGLHDITIPYTLPGGGTYQYTITYNSLPEFYKGNYFLEAVANADGSNRINFFHSPQVNPAFGRPVALQLLGRVAHLLGDMSVPAHAHAHAHPCPAGLPDFYENNMGNVYWSNNGVLDCEDDPGGPYRAQQWTAATAAQQGGLLSDMYCEPDARAKMKYLFYTLNQLAAFFPSGVNPDQRFDPSGPVFNNQIFLSGNASLGNGSTASNNFLAARFAALGSSPGRIDHVVIANETFNYSIRAVATLFQWFAFEAGITTDILNRPITASQNVVCPGGSAQLQGPLLPIGTTPVWTLDPPTLATGVASTTSLPFLKLFTPNLTLTPAANAQGLVTARLTFANATRTGCYAGLPALLQRSIWVGPPGIPDRFSIIGTCFDYSQNGPGGGFLVCPNEQLTVTPADFNYAGMPFAAAEVAEWRWSFIGSASSGPSFTSTNPGYLTITAAAQPREQVQVTLQVRNVCGWSNVGTAFFETLDRTRGEEPFRPLALTAYPNPANETLTVPLDGRAGQGTIQLRNSRGGVVRELPARGASVVLNLRDLPEGLYFLSVPTAGQLRHQTIRVSH